MKKLIQLLVIGAFLGACSGLRGIKLPQFGATPTVPPVSDTPTAAPSSTPTPTQNLFATSTSTPLTFTPTVTMIGAELFTPTGSPTPFPTQSIPTILFVTPGLPAGPSDGTSFTPEATGFLTILTSSSIMYWNEGPCSPREIKFSVFVQDTVNTDKVLLFTRLREKRNTLNFTKWNSGAIMIKEENGSFSYSVHTWNLRRYYYFREAWLEYQLVALDENLQETGRTPIYDRNLSLAQCRPVQ